MSANPELPIPRGKYAGYMIDDCPSSYLRWIASNWDDEELAEAAEFELQWRSDHHCHFESEPS